MHSSSRRNFALLDLQHLPTLNMRFVSVLVSLLPCIFSLITADCQIIKVPLNDSGAPSCEDLARAEGLPADSWAIEFTLEGMVCARRLLDLGCIEGPQLRNPVSLLPPFIPSIFFNGEFIIGNRAAFLLQLSGKGHLVRRRVEHGTGKSLIMAV